MAFSIAVALLVVPGAFASDTEFTAKVRSVLPDGTMRCKIVKFLQIDPYELQSVKRGKKMVSRVDVNFNEIDVPKTSPYREQAVRLMRRHFLNRLVKVSLGAPMWEQGKVIADIDVVGNVGEFFQLTLVKKGLATCRDVGGPPDDVINDAEVTASSLHLGVWSKPQK